jgi:hypothetical protein
LFGKPAAMKLNTTEDKIIVGLVVLFLICAAFLIYVL